MPSYRLSSKGGTKLPAADWVALEELNSQLLTGLRTILIPARIKDYCVGYFGVCNEEDFWILDYSQTQGSRCPGILVIMENKIPSCLTGLSWETNWKKCLGIS